MSIGKSIPNTPKPVAPPQPDAAHPEPNPEGSNAVQHEPSPDSGPADPPHAPLTDAPPDGPYVKRSPYTSGNV